MRTVKPVLDDRNRLQSSSCGMAGCYLLPVRKVDSQSTLLHVYMDVFSV